MAKNYIARQDGQWTAISLTPDVCKTPMGPATPPVPYPVTASLGDAVQVVSSVKANGHPVLVLDQSFVPTTKGDEPGVAKGVKSGTVGDICEPLEHSTTFNASGKPVLRHFDKFWMNARNTTGIIIGQPPTASVMAKEADPEIAPETAEEQTFMDTLSRAYEREAESRRLEAQSMTETVEAMKNSVIDFFTDHTSDGVMNSQAIGAMLSAAARYNTTPEAAQNMAEQINGEALDTFNALNTPENQGLMTAAQSLFMAFSLRTAGGADMDGAIIKGKGKGKAGQGEEFECDFLTCRSDPVDVVSGSLIQQLNVLHIPGSVPLKLSRLYRSCAKKKGLFGGMWSDDWSQSLTVQNDNLCFTDHEGVVLRYPVPQNGIFHRAVNSRQTSYRLSGDMRSELTLFDRRSQLTRVFSPTDADLYSLSAIHDRYGNRIDFLRTDELLAEIRHSDGYTLSLDWQQRQLMSIDLVTPQRQRLVTCKYDDNGFLAECDTYQFTHLWYEYTPEGLMTRWQDTDKTQVNYRYDEAGRVTHVSTPEGYYNDRFIYDDGKHCTAYLDAEGGESRFWYNEDGLITRSSDPLGREETTLWENTRLLSRTDALGRTTEYDYNSEGEISRVSLPGGYSLFYDYNESGQLTRLTTPGDQLWQWEYDDKGSMVCLTDPQGRKQQFSYSEQGDLLARIMPGGATWRWSHDALHQVREVVAPDGGMTQTGQDFLGRLLSVKDPLGFTTQFRHSKKHAGPRGSVEEISRPDGVRELMRQNSEKLPESFTDGEGKTTRYEYGAFDLLSAVIRPDGQRLECRYDKLTRLTEIINAEGESYRLTYDRAGQLIAETDFTGRTLRYEYDAAGRCIRTTFPDGTHLHRRYNVTNQVTDEDVTQGDSDRILSTTTFRYDTLCRLVEAKNNDATVTCEYDDAGRITAETINGRRTEYRHDPDLDSVSQRTTAGITEQFTRNLMGYLTSWQIADHAPLTFEHDLRGQETTRKSEAGFYQTLGYTQTGRLTTQRVGSQAEPQARDTDLQRQWLYDKAYNLTMISDSQRGTMVNSMTANDQISHATWTGSGSTLMREERFTYDSNLNITRRQTWVNEVMESEAYQHQQHGRVTSREYKEWRHSTHRINPDTGRPEEGKFVRVVSAHGITWKYDVNGRLVEKLVDKGGYRPLLWRYRWDARSQLTGLETPEGERWEYRYDPFGRRINKRCTNRDKPGMDFHWNGDQLTEEIPVGTDGTPEDVNAIRWIYEPGSFTPLARYEKGQLHYAVTDTVGRIQELLTEDGEIVWRGKQQLWGREESANDDTLSCRLRFPGQYEDAESGLYYNRFRYYDCETGQYICADPIELGGGINLYGYVVNPLGWIDPLGLAKNRSGSTPKDAREKVKKGQGPSDIKRIDKPEQDVPGSQWHAHDHKGGALNQDGSIHDKCPGFPNKVLRWLQDHGWNVDNWL
ncbi:RHS repeat-associated core domain-containing protein [Citrobacter amalonaticus]|nr:RHS repeat-associated core domain-containing protein [Citrobacter amalonaticus]